MPDDRVPELDATAGADRHLIDAITRALAAAADPDRAPGMQAYMKSAMPYLGVGVPVVRALTLAAARDRPPRTVEHLVATATALWRGATHREHRYAAAALTRLRLADGARELVPLYEEMVVTGAWWDHVDEVAPRLGRLLLAHPDELRPLLLTWSVARDRWLRRASILGQLGARSRTDVDLLTRVVDANAADPDFFVRKAIGWALRDYGRTDPAWVRDFVGVRADVLSPLSRREATKHLQRTATPDG